MNSMQPWPDISIRSTLGLLILCFLAGCIPGESSSVLLGMPEWLVCLLGMLLLYLMLVALSHQDIQRREREHAEGELSPIEAFLKIPEYDGEEPPHLHSLMVITRRLAVENYDERGWRGVLVAWGQCALIFVAMAAFGWVLTSVVCWLAE